MGQKQRACGERRVEWRGGRKGELNDWDERRWGCGNRQEEQEVVCNWWAALDCRKTRLHTHSLFLPLCSRGQTAVPPCCDDGPTFTNLCISTPKYVTVPNSWSTDWNTTGCRRSADTERVQRSLLPQNTLQWQCLTTYTPLVRTGCGRRVCVSPWTVCT